MNSLNASLLFNLSVILTLSYEAFLFLPSSGSAYDVNTHDYIGNCSYNDIENNRGEIGIVIRKQAQGNHYAKDMINALINYGYNKLNLDEIYAIVFSDNVRSLTCMKELGFVEYDRDENVLERNGISVDDVYLRLENR